MNGKGDGDAAKAKEMLAAAGYGPDKPFELMYYYTNDDDIAQKAEPGPQAEAARPPASR